MSPRLRFQLFGRFEVWRNASPVAPAEWRGQKPRDLLKILLLARGRFVSKEALCGWLWPEANLSAAEANLRSAVRDLRKLLEPELDRGRDSAFVQTRREGYAFNLNDEAALDVLDFERALSVPDANRPAVEQALALYRSDLLEEDPYAEWAQAERDRLRLLRLEALGRLVDLCLAEADYPAAIRHAEQGLALDAGRETLWRGLMTGLALSGDRAAALRAFNRCRSALARDLGVDPLPETNALHERILRGEVGRAAIHSGPAVMAEAVPSEPRWLYRLAAIALLGWVMLTGAGFVLALAGALGGMLISPGEAGAEVLPYLLAHPEALAQVNRQLYFLVPSGLLLLPAYLAWFAALRPALRQPAGPFAWLGVSAGVLDVAAHTLSRVLGVAQLTVLPPAYISALPEQRLTLVTFWDVLRQIASTFGVISATAGPLAIGLLCWASLQSRGRGTGRFSPWLLWSGLVLSTLTLVYNFLAPGGAAASIWLQAGIGLALATFVWYLALSWVFWRLAR